MTKQEGATRFSPSILDCPALREINFFFFKITQLWDSDTASQNELRHLKALSFIEPLNFLRHESPFRVHLLSFLQSIFQAFSSIHNKIETFYSCISESIFFIPTHLFRSELQTINCTHLNKFN